MWNAMAFENLTLWQRVYEHLREEILSEHLEPGAEMLAVRLAVPKLEPDDVAQLEQLIEAMSGHAERDEVTEFFAANLAFHGRLFAASGNTKLQELYAQLLGQMG